MLDKESESRITFFVFITSIILYGLLLLAGIVVSAFSESSIDMLAICGH